MSTAIQTTLSFRTNKTKCDALDEISKLTDRNRSFLLNQAVDNLLDVYQWQIEHINNGLQQAKQGEFVDEVDWRSAFAKHRK